MSSTSLNTTAKSRDILELTVGQNVATDEQIQEHFSELFDKEFYLNRLSRVLEGVKFSPKCVLKSHLDEENQQKLDACVSHLTDTVQKTISEIPFDFTVQQASDDTEELPITQNRDFTVFVSNAEALLKSVKQPLENLKVLHDLSSLIYTLEKRIAELKVSLENPSYREVNSIERSEIEISVLEAELRDFEEFEKNGKLTAHQRNQKKKFEDDLKKHLGIIKKIEAKAKRKKKRVAFTQETLDQVLQLFTEFFAQYDSEASTNFSVQLDLTKVLNDNGIDTNRVSVELGKILQIERTGQYTAYYPEVESRQKWDERSRRIRRWAPRLAVILTLAGGAYATRDKIREALKGPETFRVNGVEYIVGSAEEMSDEQREFLKNAEKKSREMREEAERRLNDVSIIFVTETLSNHRELEGMRVIRWNEVISNFDEIKKMHDENPVLAYAKLRIFKKYDSEMKALTLDQLFSIFSAKDLNTLTQHVLSSIQAIRVSGKGVDWVKVSLDSASIDIVRLIYWETQQKIRVGLFVENEGSEADVETADYQWEETISSDELCSPETKYLIAGAVTSNEEILFKTVVKPPKKHRNDCVEEESSLDHEAAEKKLGLFKERIVEDSYLSEFFDSKRKKMFLEALDLSAFKNIFQESFSSVFVAYDYDSKSGRKLPIGSDASRVMIEIDPVYEMAVKALFGDEANVGLNSATDRVEIKIMTNEKNQKIILKKERELCDINRLFAHGIFAPVQFEGDEPYAQMFVSRASIILNTYCPKTVKMLERSLGIRYEPTVSARLAEIRASILEHPIVKKHATEKQLAQIARSKTEEELKENFSLALKSLQSKDGSLAKELSELVDSFRNLKIAYDIPNHTMLNISVPPELIEALKKQYGHDAEVFFGFSNNGQRKKLSDNQPLRVAKEELCTTEGETYFFIEVKFPIRKGIDVLLETEFTGLDDNGTVKSTFCK